MSNKLALKLIFLLCSYLTSFNLQASYSALIFDVDGVLVDTEELKFNAWHRALKEKNVSFELEEYYPLVGGSSEAILDAINQQKNTSLNEELIELKEKYYDEQQRSGVPLIPEAVNFLKEAIRYRKEGNIKLALASSAPHQEIIENIKQMGLLEKDFDLVASGKDSLRHIKDPTGVNKPKPYIYQLCSRYLGIQPNECLVFEDTQAGVLAAASAGMDVIAIPNKFTRNHDFSKALKVTDFKSLQLSHFLSSKN